MNQRQPSPLPPRRPHRPSVSVGAILFVLFVVMASWWRGGEFALPGAPAAPTGAAQVAAAVTPADAPDPSPATAQPPPPSRSTPTAQGRAAAPQSGLPTIALADLPDEARQTIALIEQGGPFPFERDGVTFQNRERLLPRHPQGYYREYTVITPGARDRGARRIVRGAGGEIYYTDDHYGSFREVVR